MLKPRFIRTETSWRYGKVYSPTKKSSKNAPRGSSSPDHRCDPNDIAIAKHTDTVRDILRSTPPAVGCHPKCPRLRTRKHRKPRPSAWDPTFPPILSPVFGVSNFQICLLLPLPMQALRSNPAESPLRGRFGRSGFNFFAVCPSAHLHECFCLTLAHALPPCPMFRDASLFFSRYPHLTATFLGCVGGSKACFRALQGLSSESMTPLSSPPYPSCTSPVAKPCLSLFVPCR
jgi:hypothetical protein